MSGPIRWRGAGAARRTLAGVGVVASAALALTACSGGSSGATGSDNDSDGASTAGVSAKSVRLAYIGDLSGPDAPTELTYFKGIKAAIDVANANGGAAGREIELAAGDTKFDTAQAITEFKKYTTDSPSLAIVGINVSSMFEALDTRIKAAKIPIVGPLGVTQLTLANPYIYQAQADLPTSAEAIANFMAGELGGTPKVGVATISTASGDEWFDLFKKVAPETDATVTSHQKMDPTAVEAAAQVATVQEGRRHGGHPARGWRRRYRPGQVDGDRRTRRTGVLDFRCQRTGLVEGRRRSGTQGLRLRCLCSPGERRPRTRRPRGSHEGQR